MAQASKSSGGVLGLVIGAVLVAAILGSPFYFSAFRSDDRALDASIAQDMETLRRVVLNIDENLSELDALAATEKSASKEKLSKDEKSLTAPLAKPFDESAQAMRRIEKSDGDRGTPAPEGAAKIVTGLPDGQTAAANMRSKYLKANDKLLQEANKAASRLNAAAVGNVRAVTHLGASQLLGILRFTEGRMHLNRARMEQHAVDMLLADASDRALQMQSLRRAAGAAEAARPTAIAEQIEEQLAAAETTLAKQDEAVEALSKMIAAGEQERDQLAAAGVKARTELAQMDPEMFSAKNPAAASQEFAAYAERYRKLSEDARRGEAGAAVYENGTLKNAKLADSADEDALLTASYEGGEPMIGLRDLRLRLGQLQAVRAEYEKTKTELEARRRAATETGEAAAANKTAADKGADALASEVAAIMKSAKARLDAMNKAADAAVKSFDDASAMMVRAASAAQARAVAARTAISEAGKPTPDERLEMISKDAGIEAAVKSVQAEVDYNGASAVVLKQQTLQAYNETERFVAQAGGGKPDDVASVDKELETHRREAGRRLTSAVKFYDDAAKALRNATVKTADGKSVTGASAAWQAQVGQAAALLLKAHIAKDAAEAAAAREQAYTLLADAAKGKDRSPLLAPAIDTLLYLQQTAGR